MVTVKDLIEALSRYPSDKPLYIGTSCHGCFEPLGVLREDARGMLVLEDYEDDPYPGDDATLQIVTAKVGE